MKTRAKLIKRFDTRLKLAKNSTLFSSDDKNDFVNDAIVYVNGLHKWPQREMCVTYVSGTEAGYGYYDYPNSPVQFSAGSIRTLVIDNIQYQQKDYYDLMKLLRDEPNPSSDIHYFANFGSWFFIYPVININGLEIKATGVTQASPLTNDTDTTIWSDDMEQLNEAVVSMMLYYATGQDKHLSLANSLSEQVWSKYVIEKQKDVPLDRPFLKVIDFFRN